MTDVLIVIATIALLAGVFLPMLARSRPKAARTNCISNIKQVGLGFRIWANDNGDEFPWAVPAVLGGTRELATTTQVFRHFQITSNEMSTPKILVCPTDSGRANAVDWRLLKNSNLSYFAGLDADEGRPETILTGDRTISTNGNLMPGIWQVSSNGPIVWAKGIHAGFGNIGLADGNTWQPTNAALQLQLQKGMQATNRFAVP